MNQFKVGDVCVGQNLTIRPQYNGEECTVIGGLEMRQGRLPDGTIVKAKPRYRVQWSDGFISVAEPKFLRRKEPPKPKRQIDTVVPWSDCLWRPTQVPV